MPRRYRPPLRPPFGLAVALGLTVASSCGPRTPTAAPASAPPPAQGGGGADTLDSLERRVSEVIGRVRESAVALEYTAADAPSGARRVASGVVISQDGDVLSVRIDTPSASSPVVARVASGRRLPAQWVAADPETGVTLLKIAPNAARPAILSTRGARLGIPVLVIGNPFGLAHSVSRGHVSGLGRRLELGPRQLGGLIQVDASLHPGDSGALLADLQGGWLGVIRSGLASPPAEGDRKGRDRDRDRDRDRELDHDLGFALPARDALWVADQLRARRRVDRAYLGVTMDLSAPPPSPPGEPDGAVLGRVLADTPGERAGLKSGDRVVALDGHPVRSPYDLTDRLDRTPADAEVTLDLLRGTGPARLPVRLTFRAARRPPFEPSRPSSASTKSRPPEPRPTVPREVAETIGRLERRIDDLEKEKREAATAQARQP